MSETDPHVVLRSPNVLFCRHCGETYEMNLPVSIEIMVAAARAFEATHKEHEVGERGIACSHCFDFGHETSNCPRHEYGGDWRKWLVGPDTGASSKTLCRVLGLGQNGVMHQDIRVPLDAGDFGRCYRLLKAIPGWRARIGEMRTIKGWASLADAWDDLERLYEEELPTGYFIAFTARLRALETA